MAQDVDPMTQVGSFLFLILDSDFKTIYLFTVNFILKQ